MLGVSHDQFHLVESTALRGINASAGESDGRKCLMNLRERREVGLRVEIRGPRVARLRLERREVRLHVRRYFRVKERIEYSQWVYTTWSAKHCPQYGEYRQDLTVPLRISQRV